MPTRVLTSPAKEQRPFYIRDLKEQVRGCEHPRCPFPLDQISGLAVHEGLVSFGEMSGVIDKDVDLLLALSPANTFVLHNMACHIGNRPSKEDCVEMLRRRPKRIWQHYGFKNAQEAVTIFYGRLKELHEQGKFKQFPGLPKNLEILF